MFKVIISIFSLSMIVGCAANQSSNKVLTKPNKVIINNIPLSKQVKISSFSTRFVNNILQAYIEVQNLSKQNYNGKFEYRFKWYDKEKYEIGKNLSIWKPLFLDALDTKKITGFASMQEAESFKFYVREIEK